MPLWAEGQSQHEKKSVSIHLQRKYAEELDNVQTLSKLDRRRMIAAKGKNTLRSLVRSSLTTQKYLTKAVKKPVHTWTRWHTPMKRIWKQKECFYQYCGDWLDVNILKIIYISRETCSIQTNLLLLGRKLWKSHWSAVWIIHKKTL